jgi:hypothetical protein
VRRAGARNQAPSFGNTRCVLFLESGGKWWLKHVVAPSVAGAGIVPLMLAATGRLPFKPVPAAAGLAVSATGSASHPLSNVRAATSVASAPPVSTSAPDKNLATAQAVTPKPTEPAPALQPAAHQSAAPGPAAEPRGEMLHASLAVPQPGAEPPREMPHASFYASDSFISHHYSSHVAVQRGSMVGLHWAVTPGAQANRIHLRAVRHGRIISDEAVPAAASRTIEVDSPTEWTLTEVRPDGDRVLGELNLTVWE